MADLISAAKLKQNIQNLSNAPENNADVLAVWARLGAPVPLTRDVEQGGQSSRLLGAVEVQGGDGQATEYRLFRDPENEGGFLALTNEQMNKVSDGAIGKAVRQRDDTVGALNQEIRERVATRFEEKKSGHGRLALTGVLTRELEQEAKDEIKAEPLGDGNSIGGLPTDVPIGELEGRYLNKVVSAATQWGGDAVLSVGVVTPEVFQELQSGDKPFIRTQPQEKAVVTPKADFAKAAPAPAPKSGSGFLPPRAGFEPALDNAGEVVPNGNPVLAQSPNGDVRMFTNEEAFRNEDGWETFTVLNPEKTAEEPAVESAPESIEDIMRGQGIELPQSDQAKDPVELEKNLHAAARSMFYGMQSDSISPHEKLGEMSEAFRRYDTEGMQLGAHSYADLLLETRDALYDEDGQFKDKPDWDKIGELTTELGENLGARISEAVKPQPTLQDMIKGAEENPEETPKVGPAAPLQ